MSQDHCHAIRHCYCITDPLLRGELIRQRLKVNFLVVCCIVLGYAVAYLIK